MTLYGLDAAVVAILVIFVGALIALIFVCGHKHCQSFDVFFWPFKDVKPEKTLINDDVMDDFELDDVRLHPNIEKILTDEQWVDDATGLIPHCLSILKKCHNLTEKLVAVTMKYISQQSHEQVNDIIQVAKKISPRVDDVVRAMYPPLDPRLLEARCIALILSVNHLALVTKSVCKIQAAFNWIEGALIDMEEDIQVLREAGLALESSSNETHCVNCNENMQQNPTLTSASINEARLSNAC